MKKFVSFLLVIMAVMTMSSCKAKPDENGNKGDKKEAVNQLGLYMEEISFKTHGDWFGLLSMSWDEVFLSEESAEKYPELKDALNEFYEGRRKGIEEYYSFLQEPLDYTVEESWYYEENSFSEIEEKIFVKRADDRVLSLFVPEETLAGYQYFGCVNFDTKEGKRLELGDVFKDTSKIPGLVAESIYEKYPDLKELLDKDNDFEESLEIYFTENDIYTWILGYEGVRFYFSAYELGEHFDNITAEIWFDENPELFNEKYMEIPESYTVQIDDKMSYIADIGEKDSVREEIAVFSVPNLYEYGWDGFDIYINGKWSWAEDVWFYGHTPYFVHIEEGGQSKDLLFVEVDVENGYKHLFTYDVSKGEADATGKFYLTGLPSIWSYEEFSEKRNILTKPELFTLEKRVENLSTMFGYAEYKADLESGSIKMLSEDYDLSHMEFTIKTKSPVEVIILPEMEKEEIPEGTSLEFLRSDDETYVDMLMPDGRECRIEYDNSSWPITVNSKDIMDLFDDMMFAG